MLSFLPWLSVKSIVKSVSTRISRLSANEDIFRANEDYYNGALARAGFSEKIEYLVQEKGQEGGKLDKKNRKETKPKGIKLGKGEGIEKHKACLKNFWISFWVLSTNLELWLVVEIKYLFQ